MSAAGSTISESQLGLTQSELLILRQQTEVALQSRSQGSAMAERGRGTSRHSQPSSRAASAASSHGSMQGRITLGSTDLGRITQSMDSVVRQMQTRYQQIEQLLEQGVAGDREGYSNTNAAADRELERTKKLIRELDRLDEEMEKVQRVCAVVRGLRAKVDTASDRLDRAITIQVSAPRPTGRPR